MRRITLIGNLTKDAEAKSINNGNAITFTLAVNEKYKDKNGIKVDKPYYYDCTIWTDNSQLSNYLKKGVKMYVEGSPDLSVWKDKDGNEKGAIKVRVNHYEFLSSSNNSGNNSGNNSSHGSGGNGGSSMQPNTNFSNQGGNDDLPF